MNTIGSCLERSAMEIEKKFKVNYMPEGLDKCCVKEIEQGYLCRKPTIRIRKSNDEYILTYKRKLDSANKADTTIVNEEAEFPLSSKAYEHLREKTDNHLIKKTRYLVPLEGGLTAELDVFHERLSGLRFVEVEFESEEAAADFVPPEWFGCEVSGDKRYSNGHLSELEEYDGFAD